MLANTPSLLKTLFIQLEYNAEGIYGVKFCKNGEWIEVFVDEYIACYPKGGQIMSS